VNKLFQKGNPLVGFTVHTRLGERDIADSDSGFSLRSLNGYGVHSKFSAMVSSSAEQETIISGPTSTTGQSNPINSGEDKALGLDEELFVPVVRTARFNDGKLWSYIGPMALIGAKIVEKQDAENTTKGVDTRLYYGIKIAMNPELYTDILYGRTSSLHSKRLELRSQLPIYKISENSRFFLGGIANIGVKDKVANEADNYRIYISWNVTFDAIRARAEKFVKDTPLTGRVEAVIGDNQFLGVSEPKKHRDTLVKAIAEDVRMMQSSFGGAAMPVSVNLSGMEARTLTRPVGPLDLEIYIPYSMSLRSGAGS
jgi:hypothetical protein